MSKRKDFEQWKVSMAYNLQEGLCIKCGNPLGKKFHRHHKDGHNSNNSLENLELHCAVCHGGEAYTTHIKQKKGVMGELSVLIRGLNKKEVSGSAGQVELEAIKLKLKLIEQVYPDNLESLPADIRVRNYLIGSGLLLKEYENGFREGMLHSNETIAALIVKLADGNKKANMLVQLLAKKAKKEKD